MTDPISYTIDGAVAATGISRSRIYLLMADGVLRARKAGRRTLIDGDDLRRYVDSLPDADIRVGTGRTAVAQTATASA